VQDGQACRSRSVDGVPAGDQQVQDANAGRKCRTVRRAGADQWTGFRRVARDGRRGETGMCDRAGADGHVRTGKSANRGEGKGCTPSDRLPAAELRRAGAAVPSDWKVVFGHAQAIPAVPASGAGHADTGNRSHGRLMAVKPTTPGPRCYGTGGPRDVEAR
jgi:hypothetical protein